MPPIRTAHLALWVAYAVTATTHIGALLAHAEPLARVTQMLIAPLLIAIVLTAVPRAGRTVRLLVAGLVFAGVGDTLSQLAPGAVRTISAGCFLAALVLYSVALAPLWARSRDALRMALAIPYGGVVIGLFVACADGAGPMLPLVGAYAVALATMAFLSAGGNGLTWSGGTLFLLSSSMLAMDWFLPGAAITASALWVMITYMVGQALLVAGVLQTQAARRWSPCGAQAALVIIES